MKNKDTQITNVETKGTDIDNPASWLEINLLDGD